GLREAKVGDVDEPLPMPGSVETRGRGRRRGAHLPIRRPGDACQVDYGRARAGSGRQRVHGERQAAGDQNPAEQACGTALLKEREEVHVTLAEVAWEPMRPTRNGMEAGDARGRRQPPRSVPRHALSMRPGTPRSDDGREREPG